MSSFDPDKNLPGCMMPDGGECCEAYAELYSDWKRLKSGPAPTPGPGLREALEIARAQLATLGGDIRSNEPFADQIQKAVLETIDRALSAPTPSPAPVAGLPPSGVEWPEPKVTNPDIANPTGVPYFDCLIHRVLDAQQDINFHANEGMSQSLCEAASLLDEVESVLRKSAALSRVSVEAWQPSERESVTEEFWKLRNNIRSDISKAAWDAINRLEELLPQASGDRS